MAEIMSMLLGGEPKTKALKATELKESHPLRDRPRGDLRKARNLIIQEEAHTAKVPVQLALAMADVENEPAEPCAVSSGGAVGMMQVMPDMHGKTAQELMDPRVNIRTAMQLLRKLYDRHGSWNAALRAYNGALNHPEAGASEYVDRVRARMQNALRGDRK